MAEIYDRNEEVKRRVLAWEEKNNKKLKDCNRQEWIKAVSGIMAMTELETADYLDHLIAKKL